MKKYKKIVIFLSTIIILIVVFSLSVTYLVNNWYTKENSTIEDGFYDWLDKLENMNNELWNIEEDIVVKRRLYNIFSFFNIINTTNASYVESREVYPLKENTNKILEKYYILSQIDRTVIPDDVFKYWIVNFKEFPYILNSYDYLNWTKTLQNFIEVKKSYKDKIFYKDSIHSDLKIILENYFYNKLYKSKYTYLPKDINDNENYHFMIKWLSNHKYLVEESKKLAEKYNYDYKLTIAAILTEQFRYAWTYRWVVKSHLKKTPFIFSMTQFSYWVWWIKENTGKKIYKDAFNYWFGEAFNIEKNDDYTSYSMKDKLKDTKLETIYPNMLVLNILTRWKKEGYDISKKPWIVLTLYNFWNLESKKPHSKPEVGGADIKLNDNKWRTYTFWWLWEALYYYIKINDLYN